LNIVNGLDIKVIEQEDNHLMLLEIFGDKMLIVGVILGCGELKLLNNYED
jgi:hypothetical protein